MECPVCKTEPVTPVELEQSLTVAACAACGGYWLSHDNYEKWLAGRGETMPEKPFSEVEIDVHDVQDAKLCPDCGRILLKYKVGHGLDFFVDHCSSCGGVWLDKNEWSALRNRNLHDEIHRIFSTSWQSRVRDSSIRDKLDAVYANRFGQEAYAKLKDIRTWVHSHPQTAALVAFIEDEDPYTG